ncbi:MAG: hypothetical protein KBT36_03470 [Kurthia sp.]|nr:hypothetical protein [Candidatus Kurthia equi]
MRKDNGVWSIASEVKMPMQDKTPIAEYMDFESGYSQTVAGNGSGSLTAFNYIPATASGVVGQIEGNFTGAGTCVFFTARNVSGNSFIITNIFEIEIPGAGFQSLDATRFSVNIEAGDFLGVSIASTSQPRYGTDATVGFGWRQTQSNVQLGLTYNFSTASTANFAFKFNVADPYFAPYKNVYSKSEVDNLVENLVDVSDVFDTVISNDIVAVTGVKSAAGMMNNVACEKGGYLRNITIRALNAGVASFQILKRETFNSNGNPLDKDTFSVTGKNFTIPNVSVGLNTYEVPGDVYIEQGEYLFLNAGIGVDPVYSQSSSVTEHLGWWQTGSGVLTGSAQFTYQPFSILFAYEVMADLFERVGGNSRVTVNRITLTRNSENYNSLRNLINSIDDASENNQYEIFVPDGEYFEVDIWGKKHVKIIGESLNAVLYMDSTDLDPKYVAPDDYYFTPARGVHLSEVEQAYLHVVFARHDCYFENLTLRAKRAKYPCHLDASTYEKAVFVNVKFEEENCNYTVGMGVWSGQSLEFYNCISKRAPHNVPSRMGVFIHNWNNQAKACRVHFENTEFINSGYAMLDELGSDQLDRINFINCINNSRKEFILMVDRNSSGTTYWTNPVTGLKEPNPQNIPYCLFLNTSGTEVNRIYSNLANNFGAEYNGLEQREVSKFLDMSITDYYGIAHCLSDEVIQKGDILARTSNGNGFLSTTMVVKKFQGFDYDIEIIGVALENNQVDENNPISGTTFKYIPIGKVADAKVSGAVSITNRTNKLVWDDVNKVLVGNSSANLNEMLGLSFGAKTGIGVDLLPVKIK